jgi:DASH complex subunit DAD3
MEASESAPTPGQAAEDLSPLEQDVLEEYERLAENMKKVCDMQRRCLAWAG